MVIQKSLLSIWLSRIFVIVGLERFVSISISKLFLTGLPNGFLCFLSIRSNFCDFLVMLGIGSGFSGYLFGNSGSGSFNSGDLSLFWNSRSTSWSLEGDGSSACDEKCNFVHLLNNIIIYIPNDIPGKFTQKLCNWTKNKASTTIQNILAK